MGDSAIDEEARAVGRRCLIYVASVIGGYLVLDVVDYLLPNGLDLTIARLCMVVLSVALVRVFFLAWWWWHLRRRSRASS